MQSYKMLTDLTYTGPVYIIKKRNCLSELHIFMTLSGETLSLSYAYIVVLFRIFDGAIICFRNRIQERPSVSDAVIFHRKESLRMYFGHVKKLSSLRAMNHGSCKMISH